MANLVGTCGNGPVVSGSHLRKVPTKLRLELFRLRRLDNWRNAVYLAADWLAIAAAIAAAIAVPHPAIYVAAVIVIGSRQRALMNLAHEASHRKLFASQRANDGVGKVLAAFPLLTSLSAYTCAHCRHHGRLWDTEGDPKVARYRRLGLVSPRDHRSFWWLHVVRPLTLFHAPYNAMNVLSREGEPRVERVERIAFWLVLAAAGAMLGLWRELLLFWFVPFLTTFQVIRYWTEMAEHAGLPTNDPWLATRNWDGSWLARFLLAPHRDDLYHLTHHLFPGIPHYRLAKAHELLMEVPEYAAGHHCDGFFLQRQPDAPSVLQDIRDPGRFRSRDDADEIRNRATVFEPV